MTVLMYVTAHQMVRVHVFSHQTQLPLDSLTNLRNYTVIKTPDHHIFQGIIL